MIHDSTLSPLVAATRSLHTLHFCIYRLKMQHTKRAARRGMFAAVTDDEDDDEWKWSARPD